jgi:uncharacterized surface protein with fasciclin (FAS1) repeats
MFSFKSAFSHNVYISSIILRLPLDTLVQEFPMKIVLTSLLAASLLTIGNVHAGGNKSTMAKKDIVDVAIEAGSFTTLATALQAADLVSTLKGDGPFTVFAPTDEAFASLPEGTVESLLKPENKDQLIAVLTYHVVPGIAKAADVVSLSAATTVNGQDISIEVIDGGVRVDNANVIQTDITASNGVIHVIDQVILPNSG